MASKARRTAGGWSLRSRPGDWDILRCERCGREWRRVRTQGACRCGAATTVAEKGS